MGKRRVIIRITPLGYTVLCGLVGVLVLGITMIALFIKNGEPDTGKTSATPTPAPASDSSAPVIKSVSAGSYVASSSSVSVTLMPQIVTPTPPAIATTSPSPTLAPKVISGVTEPTAEQVKFAVDGKLTGNGVAFRKGPATSYAILDKYSEGIALKIFGLEGDYYFCQIVSEGERYGYFATKFVTKFGTLRSEGGDTATAPTFARGAYQGVVIADKGVALRTMPSTSGNTPIGECAKNEALNVYFQTGDFYYIEVVATGLKAYAYAAFISVNGSVPQGTPVP